MVEQTGQALPEGFQLWPNYPNPFNPATLIRYALPHTGPIQLRVYDILGRPVCALVEGVVPAGVHLVSWDGRNEQGQPVGSGVYLYVLQGQAVRKVQRMVLVR